MRRLKTLLQRFRRDESGSFLVIFALLAVVLIATSGAVVDFSYTQTARSRAQTALDAAALALQPKINDVNAGTITKANAEADIKTKAQQILRERLADSSITATVDSATMDTTAGKLDLSASLTVPTSFVQLVGIRTIGAKIVSEVTQGSTNLEIAVALDTTGSMAPCDQWGNCDYTKINALKTASGHLIDLVVKDTQTPSYTKMALVPYSMGVNVGSYATSVRGAIAAGFTITGAAWASGSQINISNITKANPGVVTTSTNHGFANGDTVYISGVSGMTQVNGKYYTVGNVTSTTFSLGVSTSGYSSYSSSSSDKVQKCLVAKCEVRVTTSATHDFATNDNIYIANVAGMTQINNSSSNWVWPVGATTATTFVLTGSLGPSYGAYTSGGNAYCTVNTSTKSCQYYYYANANSGHMVHQVSTCVSERGTNPFTDDPPTTTLLGKNYPASSNWCIGQTILPLTSDKTALHGIADNLVAGGSTSGHVGLAWAWYLVSPKFGYLWPTTPIDSRPAAYTAVNTKKIVILMTDGAFNSPYCNGVISADATSGSGSANDHINCNATDGSSYTQANALCDAIKGAKITLYTVGFDIASDANAQNLMATCATDSNHAFIAATGADLDDAFRKIAEDLNSLRISH